MQSGLSVRSSVDSLPSRKSATADHSESSSEDERVVERRREEEGIIDPPPAPVEEEEDDDEEEEEVVDWAEGDVASSSSEDEMVGAAVEPLAVTGANGDEAVARKRKRVATKTEQAAAAKASERRVSVHKASVVCFAARLRLLSRWCDDETCRAAFTARVRVARGCFTVPCRLLESRLRATEIKQRAEDEP